MYEPSSTGSRRHTCRNDYECDIRGKLVWERQEGEEQESTWRRGPDASEMGRRKRDVRM